MDIKTSYYPTIVSHWLPAIIEDKPKKRLGLSDVYEYKRNEMVIYRITPHSDVSNNNKRLWKSIYKMYEMYEKPGTRLERDGFKFTFREKDYFWFDVIFRQIDGKKSVEFYIATSEFQAQKLKRKIENKISVTFTEATLEDIHIPEDNTVVQDLRYLKHDIFTLNSTSNDVKTPISSVLYTVDELMHDGDIARLSVCNEVENRNKWVKTAQWAYEKANKGVVPQRANVNGKRVGNYLKIGISNVVNEINSVITDIFQALQNSFFKSDNKFENQKLVNRVYSLEDEIGTTRLDKNKGNLPVFKTHIRVVAHSKDRLTRDSLSESLALSFQDITETNELTGVKITVNGKRLKVIQELNTLQLSKSTRLDHNVNLISTDEMSKLALMMPDKKLQRKYADEMNVKKRTEVEISHSLREENGIEIGVAELKDNKIPIRIPVNDPNNLFRGHAFIGGQGAGKDSLIKNFVVEANLKHNISFVVIDAIVEEGEKGMADGIRDALPPDRIIDLDMNDSEYIPPMDLTEVVSSLGRNGASRFADEMIDFMQIDGLNRSEKYLTESAQASGGNLYNVRRIIEEEEFRVDTIERLIKEGNIRLANKLASWGTNEQVANKCDAIINRLNRFFGNERLFDIFAQEPIPELDFRKWMSEGKVIIIRVPNGRGLGEHAVKTLVHWITLKTFMTRMLMSKEGQKNGCFMIFNEPEQYESDGLTKLLGRIGTEGRKERLGSIYAFHHWNKLSPSLQENLQGGGVQQFIFMNDHKKTFDLSKHRFEDTIPLDEAYRLPAHHAIVSIRANKELQPAFICKMNPPIKSKYNNSHLTKQHTKKYGRAWSELQQTL